ncbi:hypothetical protein KG112_14220 [Nocardioides sp. zg-ZUI104]|uniref:hypothetical protein n=1 Tax=Nocardioides faecalis TaxID=2803858 RepID=UPI001BCD687F|nr:hypothetical protein [Nocardioides faecalis]MBS4753965.1 hypothetical protein [Nocardioides faecalis]
MNDQSPLRRQLLQDAIALRIPPASASSRLKVFSWDVDEELVTLTLGDVRGVVERYLAGDLSDDGIGDWAEFIESRDDIGYEPRHRDLLADLIFELATPEIFGPMPDVARGVVSRLRAES